jgi:FMN phosphatase YigB (HAD superfamily)
MFPSIDWTTRIKVIFWDLGGVLVHTDCSETQTMQAASFKSWRGSQVDWTLVSFVRLLRRSYRMAALCDAPASLRQALEHSWKVAASFDAVMRCGPQDYPAALTQMGVEAGQAVLVDDKQANIRRARALGIYAVRHTSVSETVAAILRLLAPGCSATSGSMHDILEQLQQRAGAVN